MSYKIGDRRADERYWRIRMSDYTELIKTLKCCSGWKYRCTECSYYERDNCYDILMCDAVNAIEELQKQIGKKPFADVEERKTGEWEWELADNGWVNHICSNCGYTKNTDIHVYLGYNYCPHCGARMVNE